MSLRRVNRIKPPVIVSPELVRCVMCGKPYIKQVHNQKVCQNPKCLKLLKRWREIKIDRSS